MESRPGPWISALRHSHDRLRASVEPLGPDQLTQQSYPTEWSIAQVLSHLGSQAEIFGLILEAGLAGQEPPGPDVFPPIWDKWNAKDPQAQATDALRADQATLQRLESMDADERARLRLKLFGMDIDTTGFARLRLSEHAVHTWDVLVALDPAATLAPDAVALLIDVVGQGAGRSAKPDGQQRTVRVSTTSPERQFILVTGDEVELTPADGDVTPGPGLSELRLPAEALIRLVYGRLDEAHTPPAETAGVELGELRPIFPGF
ncbi:MAG TPA: maleylpyruvate isomerase family mycothiol-dependent enzyme [Streptosporangiaceae bacterium]|nr:maleylpyruvate isomerase family mycothiol-dependent enzyme [Streptosporangiaceae bacterium]